MAMNPTALAAQIKTGMLADPKSMAQDNPALDAMCSAIAAAVVQHITTSGAVVVVTACPAGAGSGTGTVT